MGDPEISVRWLAMLINDLEKRTGQVAVRQRAGARFDTAKGIVLDLAESEPEPGDEADPGEAEDRSRSSSRCSSRSSRSHSTRRHSSTASSQAGARSEADLRTAEPAPTAQTSQSQSSHEDDVSVCTHHNSSWENFYETLKVSLRDCQACNNWSTNPHNLADVLKSIGSQIQKLNSGPPEETEAWQNERLEEVVFCISSYRREQQLKKALPLNLACLAPYRQQVRVVVVTFGPDVGLQEWLRSNLEWAVEEGLLQLASGGDASGTAPPAHVGSWSHRPGMLFGAWHASVAKNTSHLVALQTCKKDLSKTLLINLDNDNLVGNSYLSASVEAALSCKRNWHGGACPAVSCGTGSLTGRLAYWALDFCALYGYDQEPGICPSGH